MVTAMLAWAPECGCTLAYSASYRAHHIGIFGIVQGAQAVDGQLFNLVHYLAAAVIALARVALCIFVGAYGAHGFQHFVGDIIFRGNEFQAGGLALLFLADKVKKLRIAFHIEWLVFPCGMFPQIYKNPQIYEKTFTFAIRATENRQR